MENASKALLIAAAVLIVILVIAFGMSIFNSAESKADAEGASTAISEGIGSGTVQLQQALLPKEVREFNAQFILGEYMDSETAYKKGAEWRKIVNVTAYGYVKDGVNIPFEWGRTEPRYIFEVAENGRNDEGYITAIKLTYHEP